MTLCCGILTIETSHSFLLPQQVEKSSSGGFESKLLLDWAKWSIQHNGTKSINFLGILVDNSSGNPATILLAASPLPVATQKFLKCFSKRLRTPYNNAAIRQSNTIESITQSILKTCDPYMIRQPRPSLAARNSPITTPIRQRPISTFRMLKIVGRFIGKITFVRQSA